MGSLVTPLSALSPNEKTQQQILYQSVTPAGCLHAFMFFLQKHYIFVRSGTGEWRFPGLGSLKLYSSCYQLFPLSFFTVKLHSYNVKYMFLTLTTQWNSIGRRNRRWKAALEPLAQIGELARRLSETEKDRNRS